MLPVLAFDEPVPAVYVSRSSFKTEASTAAIVQQYTHVFQMDMILSDDNDTAKDLAKVKAIEAVLTSRFDKMHPPLVSAGRTRHFYSLSSF